MNILYLLSSYISHRRAGEAYAACLKRAGHALVDDPARADIAVFHDHPPAYADARRAIPELSRIPCVGYAVWETERLPQAYIEGLRHVDAVWTCSDFSLAAFAPHHPRAAVLPHVVERPRPSQADLAWVMNRLNMRPGPREQRGMFYFYTITDTVNPRKNIETLLSAWRAAFPNEGTPVRLVVKQYRSPQALDQIPGIINLPEELSDGQIAALHALCDAYVSAHHAEAWGLPLSEALSFGNPVIATGWSGNMQFMTARNSFPVPYTLVPVSERMCRSLAFFTSDMTWAEIDAPELVRLMRLVWAKPVTAAWRADAAASMGAFSSQAVSGRLQALLAALWNN